MLYRIWIVIREADRLDYVALANAAARFAVCHDLPAPSWEELQDDVRYTDQRGAWYTAASLALNEPGAMGILFDSVGYYGAGSVDDVDD